MIYVGRLASRQASLTKLNKYFMIFILKWLRNSGAMSVQVERRELALCRGAARLRSVIQITLQRYGDFMNYTIPKSWAFP